jgi:hypothetical protein
MLAGTSSQIKRKWWYILHDQSIVGFICGATAISAIAVMQSYCPSLPNDATAIAATKSARLKIIKKIND